MSMLNWTISKKMGSFTHDIEVDLRDPGSDVEIYVCDPWTCHSIDLTKDELASFIENLIMVKEHMV